METPRKNDEVIIMMLEESNSKHEETNKKLDKIILWAFGESGGNGKNSKIDEYIYKTNELEKNFGKHLDYHKWIIAQWIAATAVVASIMSIIMDNIKK